MDVVVDIDCDNIVDIVVDVVNIVVDMVVVDSDVVYIVV